MTLADWLQTHGAIVSRVHGPFSIVPIPPSDRGYAAAFRLSDSLVWQVSGGSFWFAARDVPRA